MKIKKIIMGIIAIVPLALAAACFLLGKIAETIISSQVKSGAEISYPETLFTVYSVLSVASVIVYVISVIVYFVYNLKNMYIYPDKKVGWGYMIVLIGIVAMPAYWYNFIRVRGR